VNAAVLVAQRAVKPINLRVGTTGDAHITRLPPALASIGTGAAAANAALGKTGKSAAAAGAALKKLAIDAKAVTAADRAAAVAADKLALAQSGVVGSASKAGAAQITLTRATAARVAAEEAVTAAITAGIITQTRAAERALALAVAYEKEALGALDAARANRAHTASLTGLARGAGAAALSTLGLRGAVLAANASFLAGTVAVIAFGKSLQSAANFETELNVLRVTAQATEEEMAAVSETARKLGADITLPGVAAGDAAQAMGALAKAGLSVQDSIDGARGVLQLATAAGIDNAEATQFAANALNAFGLSGDQATHVADVLTNAANSSQGSIQDMGIAFQQVSAVARQVGVSLEDTATLLTLLARNGLAGSDAGTSLRVAFTRLINPTEKAQKVIERFGLNLRDISGNIRPEVFAEFAQAQRGLSKGAQDANAAIVFGTDALRAYSIISRESTQGLNETRDAIDRTGSAAELAAARTAGLAGAAENLKNQFSTLGLALGTAASGPVTDFVNVIADGVSNINAFINFLDRSGDEADDTGVSYENLTKRALELRRAHKDTEAEKLLERLESDAGKAATSFTDAAIETGKLARAVAELDKVKLTEDTFRQISELSTFGKDATGASQELRQDLLKLIKVLEDQAPAALKARDGIEAYRASLTGAALDTQGFINAIQPKEGFLPSEPPTATTPRRRVGTRQGQVALAQSRGDLKEAERIQEQILAEAVEAERKGIHKSVEERQRLFDERIAAETALNNTRQQIADKAAADAEQTAKDIADKQKRADEKFLKSLVPARSALDRKLLVAEGTEGEADNRRILIALKKRTFAEIKLIQENVKDKERAAELIEQARQEIVRLDKQIADAEQAIIESAAERRRERADAVTASLAQDITLAELREDDAGQLRAINKAIANARFRVNNWKRLGLNLKAEKIALEQLINDRDELEKKAKEAGQGTTVLELLTEATSIFNASAGNVIGTNQPFASASAFNADFAQFLTRRPVTGKPTPGRGGIGFDTGGTPDSTDRAIDRLIDALDRNTTATQRGNSSTTGYTKAAVTALGARGAAMGAFYEARQARRWTEAESG
jgi:TP901 family phage tail tape measure protein